MHYCVDLWLCDDWCFPAALYTSLHFPSRLHDVIGIATALCTHELDELVRRTQNIFLFTLSEYVLQLPPLFVCVFVGVDG